MPVLHVTVHADIDGAQVATAHTDDAIPPGYDQRDTDLLTVSRIEATAFKANLQAFHRTAAMAALIAATARLKAVEDLLPDIPDDALRERIIDILEESNAHAVIRWGEPDAGD